MPPPKLLFLPAMALILSGCGPETETAPPPQPEPETEAAAAPPPAVPGETPTGLADMVAAQADARAQARIERGERLAERDPTPSWWDDDALAEQLGLNPEQRRSLLEFRRAVHDADLEGRGRLRDLQDQAADLEGDAERLAELQTSIGEISERLDESELAWEETVRTTLTTEQLQALDELLDAEPPP